MKIDQCSNPFRVQLISQPIQPVNGRVEIQPGPGLGVEVNRSMLEKHRV